MSMKGVRRITEALMDRALPQQPGRRKTVMQRISMVGSTARRSVVGSVVESLNEVLDPNQKWEYAFDKDNDPDSESESESDSSSEGEDEDGAAVDDVIKKMQTREQGFASPNDLGSLMEGMKSSKVHHYSSPKPPPPNEEKPVQQQQQQDQDQSSEDKTTTTTEEKLITSTEPIKVSETEDKTTLSTIKHTAEPKINPQLNLQKP